MIEFGRPVVNRYPDSFHREWLVTNGIGGYASGTISGAFTRRYHGLLFAAMEIPLGRTLTLSNLEESINYRKQDIDLFVRPLNQQEFFPQGYQRIEKFHLDGQIPVWRFRIMDAILEKRIWMIPGENTTCIQYSLEAAQEKMRFHANILVNLRDSHQTTLPPFPKIHTQATKEGGVHIFSNQYPKGVYLLCDPAYKLKPESGWTPPFFLEWEFSRGLDEWDHHYKAAELNFDLFPGETFTIFASANPIHYCNGTKAFQQREVYEQNFLLSFKDQPEWIRQLILAADQFIVTRAIAGDSQGKSIIAGYPWFGDWGRDTMISLPGLTLATGRPEICAKILRTFSHFISKGMLPNRFPDTNKQPEYNTADATLWYFEAIYAYWQYTQDITILNDLYPILKEIFHWHIRGTRYGIRMDPADSLLMAGEEGVQLTWMDVKIKDWVVTPRQGKAVEINALWYNALRIMSIFSTILNQDAQVYSHIADQVASSFQRFWNADCNYCYDVIDTPFGNDTLLRPNQLFAVSLTHSPLSHNQQQNVVEGCYQYLYTGMGLRSLAPFEKEYQGRFEGNMAQRDAAYHQGTVWGWLIGPFISAHYRVFQDKKAAMALLEPLRFHLQDFGLGSLNEIYEGDPPHGARGCIAQAWSVAEALRVWAFLNKDEISGTP
ncbi:MAG: glycogen debranching protein [Chloroflexi bacterium HGW-Chloroflexi-10]|nr:MAG: glycogen debranching protein [Chloroflexi bacterium HGW-Chloroflexi-10]